MNAGNAGLERRHRRHRRERRELKDGHARDQRPVWVGFALLRDLAP
jgi:hypothetical protein